MTTKLEEIAVKARKETNLKFTSIAHHVTKELIHESLMHMPNNTAKGIDGIDVKEAKDYFDIWADKMITSIHRESYKPPAVRRVWIPKPGKTEKRPIGVPCVADRALQRSVATVLSTIYEQDFLDCSFGGRPKRSAHNALATINETISGKKVSWVLEADLKNFFGSLDHEWLLKFVQHRVGDPRMISLINRWLKAGVIEDGKLESSEIGTPQGGSISVLLSNIYLHYVLDLWFEKVVKPKLKGESYLIRYIDDFIVCFQYREDAIKFQKVLSKRLAKFALQIEPNKTRLVEFGRFSSKHAKEKGKKMETLYFLGFTHFCTRNRSGNFMVGRKTEKTRLNRGIKKITDKMREIRHSPIKEQVNKINQILRGHYNYYGMGGNLKSLFKIYNKSENYFKKMLSSRSWKGNVNWDKYRKIKEKFPLLRPKISIPFVKMKSYAIL
ncbi:group II intron reverse transcriptase/maturase [Clostridium sp. FP1]|uniref:group II intron reverse transcriptase/maturase n=1 Tax=Clostridium sp. FP1 TaxID=2724076 RepID=UPI0013E9056A|nr:group II intron reverse transcriptase/maturase [Clostridium sp. FP1]MBZ9632861.1 group II intron reverse transcriptase/maturase [Clostridium sp. FP1]MBZ9634446.1 group II intron reverse transcriptase/maturase [Clostridium sp. FP1]MBZ9636538.1 group II intron reverse transcriptase/maturase [Clostridium sp. FP1]